jgi:2-C-methyl-D-erythritol 4-phosphate cytidylyltransferase
MNAEPAGAIAPQEVSALILGAGQGQRIGGRPKAFVEVGGETLVERAVALARPFAAEIIVGLPPEEVEAGRRLLGDGEVIVAAGGASRQDTMARLLARASLPLVLLHEVARPLASAALCGTVLAAAARFGAAMPCLPASRRDAVALREGEFLGETLPRDGVILIQTPLAFRRELLVGVLGQAEEQGWTEASTPALFARAGCPVRLVEGEPDNLKITFAEDLEAARRRLKR